MDGFGQRTWVSVAIPIQPPFEWRRFCLLSLSYLFNHLIIIIIPSKRGFLVSFEIHCLPPIRFPRWLLPEKAARTNKSSKPWYAFSLINNVFVIIADLAKRKFLFLVSIAGETRDFIFRAPTDSTCSGSWFRSPSFSTNW